MVPVSYVSQSPGSLWLDKQIRKYVPLLSDFARTEFLSTLLRLGFDYPQLAAQDTIPYKRPAARYIHREKSICLLAVYNIKYCVASAIINYF